MRRRNCRDDGQPEADAALRGGSLCAESAKGLDELIDLALIEASATTFNDKAGGPIVAAGGDADGSPYVVVPDCVVDDIRHHAGEERLVANYLGVVEGRLNREPPSADLTRASLESGLRVVWQPHRLQVGQRPMLRPCKDEEAFEQPVGLVEAPAHLPREDARIVGHDP